MNNNAVQSTQDFPLYWSRSGIESSNIVDNMEEIFQEPL